MNSNIEISNPTCIIIATRFEAEPFIAGLGMKATDARPFPVFRSGESCIIISGIGKVNAAMATAYACLTLAPVRILNLGAAGATHESEILGRIYNIDKTVEPDRLHLRTNTPCIQHPDSLQGFDKATLATRDRGIIDIHTFIETAQIADLVDMEGAAVVQAARRFGKACLIFKFVSDTPAHAGQGDVIRRHIQDLCIPFCAFILDSVIKKLDKGSIDGQKLSD